MPISPLANTGISIPLTLLYYTVMEALFGRTVGKLVTGTKVIDSNGNKPRIGTILLRSICRIIPFEPFSFFGQTHRGWHYSLSKTWVVKTR